MIPKNTFHRPRNSQLPTKASNDCTVGTDSPGNGTVLSELLTEKQVSERWNVSLNTLRFWRSTGDGPPYVKLGRSVRYNVSALEKYLRRNTCESKTRATAEEALQHVAH
jgi:predicted DNA-binding transcriptional regulator AlpA